MNIKKIEPKIRFGVLTSEEIEKYKGQHIVSIAGYVNAFCLIDLIVRIPGEDPVMIPNVNLEEDIGDTIYTLMEKKVGGYKCSTIF